MLMSTLQVNLLRDGVTKVLDQVTLLTSLATPPVAPHGRDSTGGSLPGTQSEHEYSMPSPSNATPTLHTGSSEVSTALSSNLYQGLSCLWLQFIVSKFILNIYGRDETDSGTNPSKTRTKRRGSADGRCCPVRISLEVESSSLQLDVQEKCTDYIFKVSSVECSLCKLTTTSPSGDSSLSPHDHWVPYLENSNGKLFSSTSSNLPEEVLQSTTSSLVVSQFQASGGEKSEIVFSPSHRPLSAKFQPVFLYLKGHVPCRSQVSKRLGVELNVCAFEAVVWLPVWSVLLGVCKLGRSGDGSQQVSQLGIGWCNTVNSPLVRTVYK